MEPVKRILLLDRTAEHETDLLLLLQLSGHQVEKFTDELLAINRYQLLVDSEQAFSLVVAIVEGQQPEISLFTKSFERLVLLTKGFGKVRVFRHGEECQHRYRSDQLAQLIAEEGRSA